MGDTIEILQPPPPPFLHYSTAITLSSAITLSFWREEKKKVINVQLSTRATIKERKLEVCSVLGEEDQNCPFIFGIPHQWQLATC